MRHDRETQETSERTPQQRLLSSWDEHLNSRGSTVASLQDFISFGSLSRLEKLRAALNSARPDQLSCIRTALREKRSEKWLKINPVPETPANRKPRVQAKMSLPEVQLPRSWRKALRDMRQSRKAVDNGLIDLEDRTPPSSAVIENLASTIRVLARLCEEHEHLAEMTSKTIAFYIADRHAKGNVSISIAARLKELLTFARWCELDEDIIAKLSRLQKRYARAAKGERKRKEVWAAKNGVAVGDVWSKAEDLLKQSRAAPIGSALQANLTLDAVCLALSVVCPLRCGDLHRIVIGSELTRNAAGWALHIVTQKTERPYHRPDLWPELTPFLDALIMLDISGVEFWEAYESKDGMALFSRDGGVTFPATAWPSTCWRRHFGTGAHIIRSLWHSMMFESENDDQWIALALCGQGNGRTAQHYILDARKKRASRQGRAKIKSLRQMCASG